MDLEALRVRKEKMEALTACIKMFARLEKVKAEKEKMSARLEKANAETTSFGRMPRHCKRKLMRRKISSL